MWFEIEADIPRSQTKPMVGKLSNTPHYQI